MCNGGLLKLGAGTDDSGLDLEPGPAALDLGTFAKRRVVNAGAGAHRGGQAIQGALQGRRKYQTHPAVATLQRDYEWEVHVNSGLT